MRVKKEEREEEVAETWSQKPVLVPAAMQECVSQLLVCEPRLYQ
jgi:hypothetical protein